MTTTQHHLFAREPLPILLQNTDTYAPPKNWVGSSQGEVLETQMVGEIEELLRLSAPSTNRIRVLVNGPAVAEQMADHGYTALDEERFEEWLRNYGEVEKVCWFDGSSSDTAHLLQHPGTNLRTVNPTHREAEKGSDYRGLDVAMAVEALTELAAFDTVMLVPGDGDMEPLVHALLNLGKRVMVVVGQRELLFEVEECLRIDDVLNLTDLFINCGLQN